jgi:hypothetical protein
MHLSAACLLPNLSLIPFSLFAVCAAQKLIVPRVSTFAKKISVENSKKTKQPVIGGIDDS